MGSIPPITLANAQAQNVALAPRLSAYFNGVYVPTKEIQLTQTAYGISDTLELYTWCYENSDWGQLAKDYTGTGRVPITLRAGYGTNAKNFNPKNSTHILYGFFDEAEDTYDTDETEIRGLGVLSALSDFRITQKAYMNVDAGQAIKEIISSRGLTPVVDTAGVTVGSLLKDDNAAMGRNIRAIEFINLLARGLNWTVRVQAQTVTVGFPPERNVVPTLHKTWGVNAGMTLRVTHNPYSSKNIKVKVVSYLPKTKTRVRGSVNANDPYIQALLAGATMKLPTPKTPAKAAKAASGRQSGFAAGALGESAAEEYVYNVPHITSDQADALAARIEAEIAMHEYIVQLEFTPTPEELTLIAQNSPNFLINLDGVKPSACGLYHMKHVRWIGSIEDGLTIQCLMANHEIPTNTGGE